MKNRAVVSCVFLFCGMLTARCTRAAVNAFEFKDGDRVVMVGNDFFERDLDQAYLETQLTTRFPEKNLTFRNLGYAGDTVLADARNLCAGWANFGPPEQGFQSTQGAGGPPKADGDLRRLWHERIV